MGGFGSGRWSRRDRKTTVQEVRRPDIHYLHRNRVLNSYFRALSWQRNGRPWGEIRIESNATSLDLVYHFTSYGESQDVRERVRLDWTWCNFGGKRPRFLCPGCDRRVGVLFLGGSHFLCRHCYRLGYQSQKHNAFIDRVCRRRDKLRDRLRENCWQRPKGMHQKTFDRLRDRLWDGEVLADLLMD